MCDCLVNTEKEVKGKIEEIVTGKGQVISEFVKESESGFQCKGLFFNGSGWQFILPIEYNYILMKKDGTPEKRISKHKTNMLPNYCPMCGKKIQRR